jgi:phage shock protein A
MGLFDRVGRLVRANLNDIVSKAEDPEKILEQTLIEMQEDQVQLRQAVASAIASQKRTEQQYNAAQTESNNWQQRAQLALQKGNEELAREALVRKKSNADTANSLKTQLDQQLALVGSMKQNMIALESKISEAKTKKDMLKARISAAKANEQIAAMTGKISTSGATATFERMEEKVLQMEAKSEGLIAITGNSLDQQFAALEGGSDVDAELALMKAQLTGAPTPTQALPSGSTTTPTSSVDAELEALKQEIDHL